MNIICATDNNFVQHCSVMLASVLTHNKDVSVWVLTEGLTDINYSILKSEIESKGGAFYCIIVDSKIISNLPMPKTKQNTHISPATYYRLLIPEILPIDVHKAIYLDCDVIVKGPLNDLWKIDLTGYALGAVHQMYHEVEDAIRLDYPVEYGYFNAGVLLINLDYWRKFNTSLLLLNYLTENYDSILMHDQDALNAILHKNAFRLSCKWNMLHFFFLPYSRTEKGIYKGNLINDYTDYKHQLKYYRKHPTVIHYVSKPKPWNKGCVHPHTIEYYNYAKKTLNFREIEFPDELALFFNVNLYSIKSYVIWILSPIYRFIFRC